MHHSSWEGHHLYHEETWVFSWCHSHSLNRPPRSANWHINCIFACYGDKENYGEVGHKMGHPCKLTPCDRCVALHHLANCDAVNTTELQNNYFPNVCVDTVKTTLREEGQCAYIWATVPFISEKNLHIRKKWAEDQLRWTIANWRAINFSDESIFHSFGSDGLQWCWRKPQEWLDPQYMKKKIKHGGRKVMIWGIITAWGIGRIIQIEGNLTKELYCEILEDVILGILHEAMCILLPTRQRSKAHCQDCKSVVWRKWCRSPTC